MKKSTRVLFLSIMLSLTGLLFSVKPALSSGLTIEYFTPYPGQAYKNVGDVIFSGRTIKINFPQVAAVNQLEASLESTGSDGQDLSQELSIEYSGNNYLITTLPLNILTGDYQLIVNINNSAAVYTADISIEGIESPMGFLPNGGIAGNKAADGGGAGGAIGCLPGEIVECRFPMNCTNNQQTCFNNSAITGNSLDPQSIFFSGTNFPQDQITRISRDGAQTWNPGSQTAGLNFVYSPLFDGPNTLVTPDDQTLLTASPVMFPVTGFFGGGLFHGPSSGFDFNGRVFKQPSGLPTEPFNASLIKLAYHPNPVPNGTVYLAANVPIPSPENIIVKGNKSLVGTFNEFRVDAPGNLPFDMWAVRSIDTYVDGTLRAVVLGRYATDPNQLPADQRSSQGQYLAKIFLLNFNSIGNNFSLVDTHIQIKVGGPLEFAGAPFARLAGKDEDQEPHCPVDNRSWTVGIGPEIAINKIAGHPEFGRMYLLWAEPAMVQGITDPEGNSICNRFSANNYGKNYDIYLSHSDNGTAWSDPLKINDDTTQADQVFPSMHLDTEGNLHIAFLDKRENELANHPEWPQYDVYYTMVPAGSSRAKDNVKVNQEHIPLLRATDPGISLKQVVGYPSVAYVSYPGTIEDNVARDTWVAKVIVDQLTGTTEAQFIRGDSNNSGIVDIADPINTLTYLFLGGAPITCLDSADANDSGVPDIADAIFTLTFLFLGGVGIPPPYPNPGPDPTLDDIVCTP